jgi:hypothetical protein
MTKPARSEAHENSDLVLRQLKTKALEILEHLAANPPTPTIGAELAGLLTEARAMAGDDGDALEVVDLTQVEGAIVLEPESIALINA